MTQLAKLASILLVTALSACAATPPAAAPQNTARAQSARVVDGNAAWTIEGFGGLGYTQVMVQKREPATATPRAHAEPVAVSR